MKIRYPFKNEQPVPTTDSLVINVVDGDGVAVSGATVSVEEKAETGTVTVTCQDSEENPVELAIIFLCDSNQMPIPPNDSNVVAYGFTESDGTATLTIWDKETHRPTEVTDIPFDDYYLFARDQEQLITYSGSLTVDGDEDVTITLTSGD